jgi:methylmalonyl-CoA mutase
MLDFADVIALNKFDKRGALDALRDVRKQYQRNHNLWEKNVDDMPVYGTIASQFNDPGMNSLYKVIMDKVVEKTGAALNSTFEITREMSEKIFVIPPDRTRYLSEISENNRAYDKWVNKQVEVAEKLYGLHTSIQTISSSSLEDKDRLVKGLTEAFETEKLNFDPKNWAIIENWDEKKQAFKNPEYQFKVRDKVLSIQTHTESLSHSQIPKVASPRKLPRRISLYCGIISIQA